MSDKSGRPEEIENLTALLSNLTISAGEVSYYPHSISAGMRLDEACEAWLRARGKLPGRVGRA